MLEGVSLQWKLNRCSQHLLCGRGGINVVVGLSALQGGRGWSRWHGFVLGSPVRCLTSKRLMES